MSSVERSDSVRSSEMDDDLGHVTLAIARSVGWVQALIRIPLGGLLLLPALRVLPGLNYVPSATSNRITDYSWALIVLVIAFGGVLIITSGLRWLLFAAWPAKLAIVVDRQGLTLRLGSLGTRSFAWAQIRATYRFEISVDEADAGMIDRMDPEEEMARHLPLMKHVESSTELSMILIRFAADEESVLAEKLRPFLNRIRWRPGNAED